MRFTLIGHSSLFVETRAGSILVDPWVLGSAGWRSWWHYPPCVFGEEHAAPDYVYLTHHHPDHFHYPSMRRLAKSAHVLIPRFGVDVMRGEVEGLGFSRVTEMPHGEPLELAPGVRVASYQYGFDDTCFLVQEDEHSLIDVNDCKIRGAPMRRIVERFGHPTFCLKGYSFAQAYPHCYEAEDPADLELIARDTYTSDFVHAADELGARYAVPFASMVGFLHPETWHLNQHMLSPADVEREFARARERGEATGTEVVCMQPGDRWSSETGFELSPVDWYADKETKLRRFAALAQPRIEASLAEEAQRRVRFEDFERYFGAFARALPPLVGRLLLSRPVVFHVPSGGDTPYFVLDVARRRTSRAAEPPPERATLIQVPEGVLADAIEKRTVAMIHGAMRLRARLRPGGVNEDLAFWGLLAIWEIGYLPLTKLLDARFLSVAWARRSEAREFARMLRGPGAHLGRLSRGFASDRGASPAPRG